jgi:adenylate cyclase
MCYPASAMKGRWLRGAVIGVVAGVVAVAGLQLPLAETSENRTFDLRTRLFADPRKADRDIVAVFFDQKSLDALLDEQAKRREAKQPVSPSERPAR